MQISILLFISIAFAQPLSLRRRFLLHEDALAWYSSETATATGASATATDTSFSDGPYSGTHGRAALKADSVSSDSTTTDSTTATPTATSDSSDSDSTDTSLADGIAAYRSAALAAWAAQASSVSSVAAAASATATSVADGAAAAKAAAVSAWAVAASSRPTSPYVRASDKQTKSVPIYAIVLISIFSFLLGASLIAFVVWRIRCRMFVEKVEEKDALSEYKQFWTKKRVSEQTFVSEDAIVFEKEQADMDAAMTADRDSAPTSPSSETPPPDYLPQ